MKLITADAPTSLVSSSKLDMTNPALPTSSRPVRTRLGRPGASSSSMRFAWITSWSTGPPSVADENYLPSEHPPPPRPLCDLLSAWRMGPGLTPLLPPLPQLSHKPHKRFHLLQVGILKPTLSLLSQIESASVMLFSSSASDPGYLSF